MAHKQQRSLEIFFLNVSNISQYHDRFLIFNQDSNILTFKILLKRQQFVYNMWCIILLKIMNIYAITSGAKKSLYYLRQTNQTQHWLFNNLFNAWID